MRTLLQEAGCDLSLGVVDPEKFISVYFESIPESLEENLQFRLHTILLADLKKERTRGETKEWLLRAHKVGGGELGEEDAVSLLADFDAKKEGLTFEKVVVAEQKAILPKPALVSSNDGIEGRVMHSQPSTSSGNKFIFAQTSTTDDIVVQICTHPVFAFVEAEKQSRCREIIRARVHDVRDAFQTRALMEKPFEDGGLGVQGRLLADLTEVIEQAVSHVKDQAGKKVLEERAKNTENKEDKRKNREELVKKEERVMAKRYVDQTGKMPQQTVSPIAPPLARASVAVSAQVQLQQQEGRIDTQKVRAVIEKATQVPVVKMPQSGQKPRMQDVQFTRRLAGPLEELRAMSLTEFRRLARDPVQATRRLADMIDLLTDQGFGKRVEGLQAFRGSALYHLYTSITQDALFSNSPIETVLTTAAAEGMNKLEYDALMEFNHAMRF